MFQLLVSNVEAVVELRVQFTLLHPYEFPCTLSVQPVLLDWKQSLVLLSQIHLFSRLDRQKGGLVDYLARERVGFLALLMAQLEGMGCLAVVVEDHSAH